MKPVSENELVASAHAAGGDRVTETEVELYIVEEHYFTAADGVAGSPDGRINGGKLGLLTFCVLVLQNGFTVHGSSACADEKNFDAEIGKRLARSQAKNKIWELLGFQLRTRLYGLGL